MHRPPPGFAPALAFSVGGHSFRASSALPRFTVCALFLLLGVMRGFTGWGFIGRDLASPGISPIDAAWLVGRGVARRALPLPPAQWKPALAGHCVLPNTPNNTLQESPGGISG